MNKNFKIIQLNAFSGLVIILLVLTGVISGFVVFPIWGISLVWNSFIHTTFNLPTISYFQSALLWGAIATSIYLMLRNSVSIKVQKKEDLSDYELKKIVKDVSYEEEVQDEEN